jgi:predicted CXXCH cytochrome family protein
MIGSFLRSRTPVWMLATVVVLLLGLLVIVSPAAASNPLPGEQPQAPGTEACLACHQQPAVPHTLPNGQLLDVTIDGEVYAASAHGQVNLACTTCHTQITGYPHPQKDGVHDLRDYSIFYRDTCAQCHATQFEEQSDSVHALALQEGNRNAPVCSDCHDPHTQPALDMEDGQLGVGHGAMIAQTCAQCHNAIFEEYSESVHGAGVIGQRNPDTPTCTDCHGVHTIGDATAAQFRLQSPQMCAECHTDAEVMGRYGLSTAVLDTYVSDFHGTTVTLFERTHPDQPTNKAVCFDCHGVHDIAAVDDPDKGLQIRENMLISCQRCHPDASENFPDTWMSHYIPDRQNTPLVYYVQLFYRIFIPTVLGGMGLFVLTDIFHKTGITRRRKSPKPDGEE